MTWPGVVGSGLARVALDRPGLPRYGLVRRSWARLGVGWAGHSLVRPGRPSRGRARFGGARDGLVMRFVVWRGKARHGDL